MNEFKDKKIAILGLGLEGLSSAKYLEKKGAVISILDKNNEKEIDEEFLKQAKELNVKLILGEGYLSNLSDFDVIVRSPGIKRNLPEALEAEKNGVVITSQTKLFFKFCPAEIIGVTGTKGKGTTSSLIFKIFKKQGIDAYLVGNIGKPPLDILDNLNAQSKVVFELSSFQLQDLDKSPHVAVLLMVTSEHLDYHKNLEEYIESKRNILRFQTEKDYAVINRDYPASSESDILTLGKVFQVSTEQDVLKDGAFVRDNVVWSKSNGEEEFIAETSHILLPGKHNFENVLAAITVAKIYKIPNEVIVSILESFKGLEHRLELVAEINGVKYYDDSFSTVPETAIAAIKAFDNPEILILGGSGKNSNFEELGKTISENKNIRAIIGIGREWPRIKEQISDPKFQIILIEGAKNMNQVVLAASKIAKKGDVVLLSPACASFDMFKNYKDRGEQFKEEIKKLQDNSNA